MLREYRIASPSLEGILDDALLVYEGLKRPIELLRVLDGPASKGKGTDPEAGDAEGEIENDKEEIVRRKYVLDQYFHDLYGIFMKKLSYFVVDSDVVSSETVKLQAMLQEMIKVKKLMSES